MGYGYRPGLISNSMLQTGIFCPQKHKFQFESSDNTEESLNVVDPTTPGSLVHLAIEHGMRDPEPLLRAAVGTVNYKLLLDIYTQIQAAYSQVQQYGAQYGTTYKAPEMTGFWKRNFATLNDKRAEINDTILRNTDEDIHWAIQPYDLFEIVSTSLSNYHKLKATWLSGEEFVTKQEQVLECGSLVGTIDRIDVISDENYHISDYKCVSFPYTAMKVLNSDQLNLYAALCRHKLGRFPLTISIWNLRQGNIVTVPFHLPAFRKAMKRLKHNLSIYKNVAIPAGNSYSPGCPCEFASICPYIEMEEPNV